MMTDTLQPLHLFDDERWQKCLESFLEDLARRESHTRLIDYRTILRQFFLGRDPATISREMVDLFCNSDTVHGQPDYHTTNRRRSALASFYDHAISCGIFQGDNPARPVQKPRIPHLFTDENWQACLTAWLEQLCSDETRSSYTNILLRFYRDPDRAPDLYTRAEVEAFIRSAQSSQKHNAGQPVKPSAQTINARKSALASYYAYSADYQILGDDKRLHPLLQTPPPTKGIKTEETGPAHRLLTESDIQRLFSQFSVASPDGMRDRALFTAYLYCGKRNSELRLRWQDIEPYTFTEKGVSREGFRYRYHAKGKGKEQWLYAELPSQVYSQIEWYLLATGRLDGMRPDEGIFVQHRMSPDGRLVSFSKEPLSSSGIRKILKRYARAAGLDESVCVHSFRHMNAQTRYRCGQGLLEIADAMDHSTIATTHHYLQSLITGGDPFAPALAAKFEPLVSIHST